MKNDLFLLIYKTHWAFTLCEPVFACLRYWCASTPLAFRAVFYYHSINEHEGEPRWIFPVPPELINGFNPEHVRHDIWINLDPRKWNVLGRDSA
jgi:hypothetical protein